MANLYWVYNIKDRAWNGPFPSSADATTSLRKHVTKSGNRANDKVNNTKSADFEVITVTA